jgi:phytoene/squalene synthetase
MKQLYDNVSIKCSRITTHEYSTSFSIGIKCLDKELRDPIYSIYGFVRLADEIVDSFLDYNKKELLSRFKDDTYLAIEEKISLNPILNSFQATVNQFAIDIELVDLFLRSMEMDLERKHYDANNFEDYILGSAEAVGLMCLKVFSQRNDDLYQKLKPFAMSLGDAFQKVNFLRDLNADFSLLGRSYFPGVEPERFNEEVKKTIEKNIETDFEVAFNGIRQLPRSSRLGVYVAYVYYLALFKKIRNTPSVKIMQTRIRIRNRDKVRLLAYSFFKHQFKMI